VSNALLRVRSRFYTWLLPIGPLAPLTTLYSQRQLRIAQHMWSLLLYGRSGAMVYVLPPRYGSPPLTPE
jgi:hypothetical protein